jgi:recombination protein RecR
MIFPKKMQKVVDWFSALPGMGSRSAERVVTYLISLPPDSLKNFARDILAMQESVRLCAQCGNYSEADLCAICRDGERSTDIVCVIEHPRDIAVFEKSAKLRPLYHVLGGKLNPLEGIGPEQLNIPSLVKRVESGKIRELILATGADLEGEATADYIAELFRDSQGLRMSRIAFGIPYGSTLDFANAATLEKALEHRFTVGENKKTEDREQEVEKNKEQ